ncbi:MAG: SagB/ThcOx family dehydrogenase, partial [bacterium]|nr:SagB/ThcOx family dehydrogenase [bacterium]
MALETVYSYHDRTKHHLNRYARSLGVMDWATQPHPFRRYKGAPLGRLELPEDAGEPTYDSLFTKTRPPEPVTADNLSRLLYLSLALSAWKVLRRPDGTYDSRWSLRVNPSSGNLHPTEGYVICGPVEGLSETPAVYHYAPHE